jgi:hypothetical protein
MFENINQYLPFLIPLLVLQLGLTIATVVHILTHSSYRIGNRAIWLVVGIVVSIIGPVLYFTIGKGDE